MFVRDVASPRVDWLETAEAHVFKVDLPGMPSQACSLDFDSGPLPKEELEVISCDLRCLCNSSVGEAFGLISTSSNDQV